MGGLMTTPRRLLAFVLLANVAMGGPWARAEDAPVSAWRCPAPSLGASEATPPTPTAPVTLPPSPISPSPEVAPGEVEVTSDGAIVGLDGNAELSGDVRLRQGTRSLSAEQVRYDAERGDFRIEGTVEYSDESLRVVGRGGRFDPDGTARIEGTTFELPARPARGAADALEIRSDGRADLESVWFSTCPGERPAWRIRARRIELDTRSRNGHARHAALEFQGVPLLYLPYLSFPIGSQRKSGFLFPGLGYSTRGGLEIAVPYYLNLAPNYDLTLQPRSLDRRGVDIGTEFRYLSQRSRGELRVNLLPDDRIRKRDRDWIRWSHRSDLPEGWRLDVDAESVSDPEYFEDFSAGAENTSTAFLQRAARLSYRDAHWRLLAELEHLQTLDRALAELDRPYARLPRVAVSAEPLRNTRLPLQFGIDAEIVNFDRDAGVSGWRVDASPELALELAGAGWYTRPTLGYRYTRYALRNTEPGANETPTRSLPYAAFDAGLLLERAPTGARTRITLEPRLQYLWTPFREQTDLPVFDTAVPDLDVAQLFERSRYVGADRVADANQVSFGTTARLVDASSGRQWLAATIGTIRYLDAPRVGLPGEPLGGRDGADLVAQLGIRAWQDFTVDLATQWNRREARQERGQLRLQYRPDAERAVNLAYRYQRGRLEQGEVSGAWPLGPRWNVFGRVVYDLETQDGIDRFAGFEFKACCWRARLVGRRYLSSRTGERDTGIYLQLELNGLASVGSRADAFLETAIRGYSSLGVNR